MNENYMSRYEFDRCCIDIVKIGGKLGDVWYWKEYQHDPEQKYLYKTSLLSLTPLQQHILLPENTHIRDTMADVEDMVENELEDESLSVQSRDFEPSNQMIITAEHHVVFSDSYSVPVLYFNMSFQDGKPLSLRDIWKLVPDSHQHALEEKWSFITQQEHPYLQHPCFQLHPCHTENMMKSILPSKNESLNCVLMWISAIGPIVHLNLPMEYFVKTK